MAVREPMVTIWCYEFRMLDACPKPNSEPALSGENPITRLDSFASNPEHPWRRDLVPQMLRNNMVQGSRRRRPLRRLSGDKSPRRYRIELTLRLCTTYWYEYEARTT